MQQKTIIATTDNPAGVIQAPPKHPATVVGGYRDPLVNDVSMSLSEGSFSYDAEIKEAALGALFKAANESAVAAIKAGSTSPTATLEHLSGKAAQMRGTLGVDRLSDGRNLSVEATKKAASETYTNVLEALCDKDTSVPPVAHSGNANDVQWEFHELPVCNTLEMLDSLLSCIEEVMERRNRYPFHNATLPRDILSPERSTCAKEDDKETSLKPMIVEQDQIMDDWVRSCDQLSGAAACTREDDKETNLKAMIVALDQIMDDWARSCDQSSGGAACTREDDKETNLKAMTVEQDQIMDDWARSCDQSSGGAACTREDDKETNLKAMTVEQDQIMDDWVRSCDQSSGGAACTREDDKETNLKAMTVEQDQIMDDWVRSCDQSSGGAACTREDDKETNLKAMTVEQDQIMDDWVRSCDQSSGGAACTREDDKETNLKAMIVALDQIMDDWVRSLGSPQNAQLNTAVVKLGTDHRCESPYNPLATTDGYEGVRMFENSTMRQISEQVMEPAINIESIFWRLFGSRMTEVFRSMKGRFHSIPVGLKSSDDLIKLHPCHAYASTVFQSVSDNCRECEVPLSNRNSSRLSSACPLVAGAAAVEKINPRFREIPSPEHIYEECRPKWDNHAPTMNDSVYELVGPFDPTLKADAKLL